MDVIEILKKIDFTDEEIALYKKYKAIAGDVLTPIKSDYLAKKFDLIKAMELAEATLPDINNLTVRLLFMLECTEEIHNGYIKAGLGYDTFILAMRDIRCKVNESLAINNVFGLRPTSWFDRFVFTYCFPFKRLQFDLHPFPHPTVKAAGHTLEKGDFALSCHIPSMGRLLHDDCIESYKQAYAYFEDKLKDGVLPIVCYSWLLYPRYLEAFGLDSNTGLFAGDFHIFSTITSEDRKGDIYSRVFNTDDLTAPLDTLPQNTSMQRSFVEYIKKHNHAYGFSRGIIFFDGEKVLTKNKNCKR